MSGRSVVFLLVLALLGVGIAFLPGASAEMQAPTLDAKPIIDGKIEEAEWSKADSFSFNAPRVSGRTASVQMGYLKSSGELTLGFVLPDESRNTEDRLSVIVAPRKVESGDVTKSQDLNLTIFENGDWELRRGNGNKTTGFFSSAGDSGSSPSSTGNEWTFARQRTASSWVVEMTVKVGDFEADDIIRLAFRQVDVNTEDAKESRRPNGYKDATPDSWERTILTGRPADLRLRAIPSDMEAAVGGDIVVSLPANSQGGTLTVSRKAPDATGFTPIGNKTGSPGENSFPFAPEQVGTYQLRADWEGDGQTYGRDSVGPVSVKVARPSQTGPTVLETGSLRVGFPMEAAGAPAEWQFLNTRVWATNEAGEQLPLVTLDSTSSCLKRPLVGFANMDQDDGALYLHFDPPVRRSALALISPKDSFTVNWRGYTAQDRLEFTDTREGSCGSPVFESVGSVDDTVKRIEIEYSGTDKREFVDVAFAQPLVTTKPELTVRAEPAPLHPDGAATLLVSSGSPHQLTKAAVTVKSGGTTLASETCNRPSGQVWIDCEVDVEIPPGTGSVRVEVLSVGQNGNSFTQAKTLVTQPDKSPPKPSLLPRPLLAAPGGAVAVTASAEDGSGIQNITIRAHKGDQTPIANETCQAATKQARFECKLAVTPAEDGFAFVTATYTDRAGNSVTVGPKPIPQRGEDTDGDGLPNALEDVIGTSRLMADTDGDGLSDGWEVVGVDRSGDGQAELDLAALGADPQVKDIFMEFDWAEHDGHSHKPVYGALQLVRNVFAAQGIQVHTDIQQAGGPYEPSRFDHGHAAHRNLIDPARAGIFMHVISGHMGGPSASGGATIYLPSDTTAKQIDGRVGAQLLHEMGHHLGLGHGGGGQTDTKSGSQQAAYAENYKPNYLSVMNDAYAWGIIIDTTEGLIRVPSYAGHAIGDLEETGLDEPAGIGFEVPALYETLIAGPTHILEENTMTGLRVRYTCPDEGPTRWGLAPGPIDWNCDGSSGDTAVTADINRGGENSGTSKLYSRTDWDGLSLAGASCPQYALMLEDREDLPADESDHGRLYEPLGLAPCPLRPVPTTPLDKEVKASTIKPGAPGGGIEEADGRDNDGDGLTDEGFADTDGDGVVNLIDDCPTGADGAQADQDADGRGDWCQGAPSKVSGVDASAAGGVARLSWSSVYEVWGYNVYRLDDGNVTHLGSGFPSTTSTQLTDPAGSTGDHYIVRAVNSLAVQGPPTMVTLAGETTGGGDGTDGNDSSPPEESVPGPGPVAAIGLVTLAALAARRYRR